MMRYMKNPSFSQIVAALAAVLFSLQSSRAAVETWNAAGGGNWSVNGNWTPAAAPTQADDAVFGNTGTGNTSTMDATRTINSLLYNQNNGTMHTTTFSSGQTLTVNRLNTGDVLYIGAASAPIVVTVTINGAGGTLTLSGTGDFVVRQGNSATGAQMANLDLSGLDRLNATVGRLLVGQAIAAAAVNRPSGTLLLAKTNFITLSGAAPQVMIEDAGQNANGSVNSVLTFGQETHLYGDNMRLGGQKGNATINFNGSFSGPSLQLRNADGSSRVTNIVIADNSIVNSGNSTVVTMDLSPGVVDVLAGTVTIARGNPGTTSIGNCTGTLTIGAGTFDVNTLEIGFGTSAGASGTTTGTLNVNNNSLLSTGAVLVANTSLRLARTNGGTAAVTGTLNLNGGTVVASSIVAGGGNSVI